MNLLCPNISSGYWSKSKGKMKRLFRGNDCCWIYGVFSIYHIWAIFVYSLSHSSCVWLTFSVQYSGAVGGDSWSAIRLVLVQSLLVLLHGLMHSFNLVLEHCKAAQCTSGNTTVTKWSWNLNKPFRKREDSNVAKMLDWCTPKMLH